MVYWILLKLYSCLLMGPGGKHPWDFSCISPLPVYINFRLKKDRQIQQEKPKV